MDLLDALYDKAGPLVWVYIAVSLVLIWIYVLPEQAKRILSKIGFGVATVAVVSHFALMALILLSFFAWSGMKLWEVGPLYLLLGLAVLAFLLTPVPVLHRLFRTLIGR